MKLSDELILGWIAFASLATFLLFGFDKWRARKSGGELPVRNLLMIKIRDGRKARFTLALDLPVC